MTFTLGWNIIPILITVCSIVIMIRVAEDDRGGYFQGLGCLLALPWALFFPTMAWLIYFFLTK